MKKRQFLAAATLGAGAVHTASAAGTSTAGAASAGPTLLTLTGALPRTNRGPFNPAHDILMGKHKLSFQKAWCFDFAALAALPALTIRPTLEYDARAHTLKGPLLSAVLAQAGVTGEAVKIALRAIDGYAAVVTMEQLRQEKCIVATHMDGKALALGGLGPLWAVIDADRIPERAAMSLPDRFSACPWGLYHIDIIA